MFGGCCAAVVCDERVQGDDCRVVVQQVEDCIAGDVRRERSDVRYLGAFVHGDLSLSEHLGYPIRPGSVRGMSHFVVVGLEGGQHKLFKVALAGTFPTL